jgi:uncharacterized protein
MTNTAQVARAMIDYFEGDIRRINHLLKVHGYTRVIGKLEGLDEQTLYILETAALTHDIGIKVSERKYQSAAGHYQQLEGPAEARTLLAPLSVDAQTVERVCWLIAHHHTYDNINGMDYQILVEADFLVNIDEDGMQGETIRALEKRIFRTQTGIALLRSLYQ